MTWKMKTTLFYLKGIIYQQKNILLTITANNSTSRILQAHLLVSWQSFVLEQKGVNTILEILCQRICKSKTVFDFL